MLRVHEAETPAGRQRVWMLNRNCALTPRQVGAFYLSLVAASTVIAVMFLIRGAWMVLPFSIVEMVALGVALLVYARHAIDGERVSLGCDALEIECVDGSRHQVTRFDRRTARVEMETRPRGRVAVIDRGERVAVGRFVSDRERRRFARELRQALSMAG